MRSSIFHGARLVLQKELALGMRAKSAWLTMLMFAFAAISCVSLAMQGAAPEPRLQGTILWVVLFFSSVTGMDRIFAEEEQRGTLPMLRLYGGAQAAFFGKMAYALLALAALAVLATLLFLLLMDARVADPLGLLATELLGILGMAAAGTLLGALSGGAGERSGLLAVLLLPVTLPVFLPAVFLTGAALGQGEFPAAYLGGMALYDLILTVGASMLFDRFWYEE